MSERPPKDGKLPPLTPEQREAFNLAVRAEERERYISHFTEFEARIAAVFAQLPYTPPYHQENARQYRKNLLYWRRRLKELGVLPDDLSIQERLTNMRSQIKALHFVQSPAAAVIEEQISLPTEEPAPQ
jgi:hypothetical protein